MVFVHMNTRSKARKNEESPHIQENELKTSHGTEEMVIKDDLKILWSQKAQEVEAQLEQVKIFLEEPKKWTILDLDQKLIRLASDFFVLDGKLWHKDQQGRHKLVVEETKRLDLIKQAHDD